MNTNFLIIVTTLLWGAAPIFDKAALRGADSFYVTVIRGSFVGIMMIGALFISGKPAGVLSVPSTSVMFAAISALFAGALGTFTYFKALQAGPTTQVVPLVAAYPLVTAILSVAFLGEALTFQRGAGICLIVAGIILVK